LIPGEHYTRVHFSLKARSLYVVSPASASVPESPGEEP